MSDQEAENYEDEDAVGWDGDGNIPEETNDPDAPLTEEMIAEGISLLCKTGDGMAHAYVKLDVKDKGITDINILSNYIHLRYVDMTKNKLRELSPLNALTHCLTLKVDYNKLSTAELEPLPYLQSASFTNNRITHTRGLNHPQLEHLNLNNNQIENVSDLEPSILMRLHTLELRGNKLKTTAGLNLPNLKNLFLAANGITQLEGIQRMEHLATLHLRDNKLASLEGFSDAMKNMQYINLRGNNIVAYSEVKKLAVLPNLRALVLAENPLAEEDDYRMELLINLRRLERLDKPEYTDDERQEAEEMYEQRRQEELANDGGKQEVTASDEEAADE